MSKKHTFITRDGKKYALGFNANGTVELFRQLGKPGKEKWVWKKTYHNIDIACQRLMALEMADIQWHDLEVMISTFNEAWMRLSDQISRWRDDLEE